MTLERLCSVPEISKNKRYVKKHVFQKTPAEKAKVRKEKIAQRSDPPRFRGQTDLERMAVSEPVAWDYMRRIGDLKAYVKANKLSLKGILKFDEACCKFLNNIFEQGIDLHEGTKFWAAVQDAFPDYAHKNCLVRTRRALQGWSKIDPQKTRPPIPWVLIAAMVMKMVARKKMQSAMAVLTMFTAYLRPSECLGLMKEDVVPPMPHQRFHTLHLHPSQRQEVSKVGLSDESLLLDSMMMPWLGSELMALQSPGPFLFNLNYTELVTAWKQSLVDLGLQPHHAVLYQLRHSGPSHDRFHQHRTIVEIKARGRWTSDSSLRRYEAHGRLNQEFFLLPESTQKLALRLEKQFNTQGQKSFCLPQRQNQRA